MTMGAHESPWTAEQQEWLRALGCEVLVPVPAEAAISEPAHVEASAAPGMREQPAAAPRRTSPSDARSGLLRALARAAARDEDDAEFRQLLPDLATLRGNPGARRALWPLLRSLRKRGGR